MASAKYQVIASRIADRIRRGEFAHRDRLPAEVDLAEEFAVSRGTVRQALALLQQNGLIETALGAGSFVSYDGHPISDGFGWSRSLESGGFETSARLVALGRLEIPALAEELGLPSADFLVVERVRVRGDGVAISLERSRLPWRTSFETVLLDGLVAGSLQQTLAEHGVVSVAGSESIGVALLGTQDAELLSRSAGEAFLENKQTSFDADGEVVEVVTSLLHPDHFRVEHAFGRINRRSVRR